MEGRGAAAGGGQNGPRERRGPGDAAAPQQNHQARPAAAERLPRPSYWLDLWLFVLVDLVLFLVVYLWPW